MNLKELKEEKQKILEARNKIVQQYAQTNNKQEKEKLNQQYKDNWTELKAINKRIVLLRNHLDEVQSEEELQQKEEEDQEKEAKEDELKEIESFPSDPEDVIDPNFS